MSSSWVYAVEKSVLEVFADCTRRDREELLRAFQHLVQAPSQRGDYQQKTASGRVLEVKRFGKWLVTFWPDHPVCEVRVTDVRRLVP